MYSPTWVEISFFLGTIGFFCTAFWCSVKLMPVIAIAEVKHILKTSGEAQKRKQLEEVKRIRLMEHRLFRKLFKRFAL
jgi:molybdopterin-containing oxidoreductase family membrane subunit